MSAPRYRRYTSTDIHWRLIALTNDRDEIDDKVSDDDGYTPSQALFCPYYATLDGVLGSDWGVILNPESVKFGRVVFEHRWCGCPSTQHESGEWFADHGSGKQRTDEWLVKGCRESHTFRDGGWQSCVRPVGHRGMHEGNTRKWRRVA